MCKHKIKGIAKSALLFFLISKKFMFSLFNNFRPNALVDIKNNFDSIWYLNQYSDVRESGVDPWGHYIKFGKNEGRLPCSNRAVIYRYHLWQGVHELMLNKLNHLIEDRSATNQEHESARKALETWELHRETIKLFSIREYRNDFLFYSFSLMNKEWNSLGKKSVLKRDRVRRLKIFDTSWYLEQYPDVQETTADPFEHFWQIGSSEGRDPGPNFSTTGYLYRYPEAINFGFPALAHHIEKLQEKDYRVTDLVKGIIAKKMDIPTILVCAHQEGKYLYGAERSLLDLLEAFQRLPLNVIVTVPSAVNKDYIEKLLQATHGVVIFPYKWWSASRDICESTVNHFIEIIVKHEISALYANTMLLHEPLIATKRLNLKNVIHVRELPHQDSALCEAVGASPEEFINSIMSLADLIVCNSEAAARQFKGRDLYIIPNSVEIISSRKSDRVSRKNSNQFRITLISSNLPKKGLDDFIKLAKIFENNQCNITCVIIGEENKYIRLLRRQIIAGDAPQNIHIEGYITDVRCALENTDVVLNLSHFQESFGRTVLEAMAAGLPVVAYDWGALPELIKDGESGYLAPLGDLEAVADAVLLLLQDKDLCKKLGAAGLNRARADFTISSMTNRLEKLFTDMKLLDGRV